MRVSAEIAIVAAEWASDGCKAMSSVQKTSFARWSVVRVFGSIKYFNISYGVLFGTPLLVTLYSGLVPALSWLGTPTPLADTVRLAYLASLLYVIAITIYSAFCPSIIKRFQTDTDYAKSEYEIYYRAQPYNKLQIVLAGHGADSNTREKIEELIKDREQAEGADRDNKQRKLDEYIDAMHPDAVQRFLLNDYQYQDASKAPLRWLSLFFYLAGTAVALFLLIERSIDVLKPVGDFMLIKFERQDSGAVQLDAFSYSESEFESLQATLRKASASASPTYLEPDAAQRQARRYTLSPKEAAALERVLDGRLEKTGAFTPAPGNGVKFACREIRPAGSGKGCEDIMAENRDVALVKCSLIANNKRWFGGDASPGSCGR